MDISAVPFQPITHSFPSRNTVTIVKELKILFNYIQIITRVIIIYHLNPQLIKEMGV